LLINKLKKYRKYKIKRRGAKVQRRRKGYHPVFLYTRDLFSFAGRLCVFVFFTLKIAVLSKTVFTRYTATGEASRFLLIGVSVFSP